MVQPDDVHRGPQVRRAARVLIVDPLGRLLLVQQIDPARPDRDPYWLLPGGGLAPGELAHAGARREVREELGLDLAGLTPLGRTGTIEFEFAGVRYRQSEEYFCARVASTQIDLAGDTALERSAMIGSRWWTRDELLTTSADVHPPMLLELLDAVL